MKMKVLVLIVCCGMLLVGCNKEKKPVQQLNQQEGISTIQNKIEDENNGTQNTEATQSSKEAYESIIKNYTSETTVYLLSKDFDNDGTEEALAITGKYEKNYGENYFYDGIVWFVSGGKAEKLTTKNLIVSAADPVKELKINKETCIVMDSVYATGNLTYVWSVNSGKIKNIFNGNCYLKFNDDGTITSQKSAYDAEYSNVTNDFTGRTCKNYYFYLSNGIKEYGGKSIAIGQLSKFNGGDEILDKICNNDEDILEVLYRENNIININTAKYSDSSSQYHYTLSYNNSNASVKDITNYEDHNGRYLEAVCPDLATYPMRFVEPITDINYEELTEEFAKTHYLAPITVEETERGYIIKGKAYIMKKSDLIAQLDEITIDTGKYMQIEVGKDIMIHDYDITYNIDDLIEGIYYGKGELADCGWNGYGFIFENGRCTKIKYKILGI